MLLLGSFSPLDGLDKSRKLAFSKMTKGGECWKIDLEFVSVICYTKIRKSSHQGIFFCFHSTCDSIINELIVEINA